MHHNDEKRTKIGIFVLKAISIALVLVFFASVITACNMTLEKEKAEAMTKPQK